MNWFEQIDGYCERTDFTYWSEPLNAATNVAFVIAAMIMWRRTAGLPAARALCVILAAIGIGSYLFHTYATQWASLADVVPIGAFILTYLFLTHRDILGWPIWLAALGTAAFVPFAAFVTPLLVRLPFLAVSNFYWTVPLLLLIYAAILRKAMAATARGFLIGALILCLSITLRSFDQIWCDVWQYGTHFLWHCVNAVMLGYMIHVYIAHVLAARPVRR